MFNGPSKPVKTKKRISVNRNFNIAYKNSVRYKRPHTSLAKRRILTPNLSSPGRQYAMNTSSLNDIDPQTEYDFSNINKSPIRENYKRNSNKRCYSASKNTNVGSTRVGSANTTYTNVNIDNSVMSSWM